MVFVTMPDGSIKECQQKRIKEIILELGLNENAVLVAKGDELLTPDIYVANRDEIRIISVVSGG
ncbi:MAG: thiamine biosynthesis protein ThiS [Denitrovibrio sp.]|nr:MAG: thiamine biosynthesis protein ThiS [Denitrovibrio sp.]